MTTRVMITGSGKTGKTSVLADKCVSEADISTLSLMDNNTACNHSISNALIACHDSIQWVTIQGKVNPMSKVIGIPDLATTNRSAKPASRKKAKSKNGNNTSFTYRLYLVVDLGIFEMIEWLKDVLEAPSFGDVVRQAARAYAIELAQTGRVPVDPCDLHAEDGPQPEGFKELNIRIPNRTKQRLDMLKGKTGLTYTDIVSTGLGLLVRTAKEQEALLAELEKGDVLNDTNVKKRIKTRRQTPLPVGHDRGSDHSGSVNTVKRAIA